MTGRGAKCCHSTAALLSTFRLGVVELGGCWVWRLVSTHICIHVMYDMIPIITFWNVFYVATHRAHERDRERRTERVRYREKINASSAPGDKGKRLGKSGELTLR